MTVNTKMETLNFKNKWLAGKNISHEQWLLHPCWLMTSSEIILPNMLGMNFIQELRDFEHCSHVSWRDCLIVATLMYPPVQVDTSMC